MSGLRAWLTSPTGWEQHALATSAWPDYSPRKRRWAAIGLTLLLWGIIAGSLLLLGANAWTFWLPFVPLAVLVAGMFTVVASGELRRLIPVLVAIRSVSLVLLGIGLGLGALLSVAQVVAAIIR